MYDIRNWADRTAIDRLAELVGRSWLERGCAQYHATHAEAAERTKRKSKKKQLRPQLIHNSSGWTLPCHPIAVMVSAARSAIRAGQPSHDRLVAVALEAMLTRLYEAKVSGLADRIRKLTSKPYDEYEKVLFEIGVADRLLQNQYSVEFIPAQVDVRTADMLVNGAIEVECKKPDQLGRQHKQNASCWKDVMANLLAAMNRHHVYCSVRVETRANPTPEQARKVSTILAAAIGERREGQIDLPDIGSGVLTIIAGEDEPVSLYDPGLEAKLAPAGFLARDGGTGATFEIETDYAQLIGVQNRAQPWVCSSLAAFSFRSAMLPDRRSAAEDLIREARNQFTKGRPALVCVGYWPGQKGECAPIDVMAKLAADMVPSSGTISAVLFVGGHPLNEIQTQPVYLHKNQVARLPLPIDFRVQ